MIYLMDVHMDVIILSMVDLNPLLVSTNLIGKRRMPQGLGGVSDTIVNGLEDRQHVRQGYDKKWVPQADWESWNKTMFAEKITEEAYLYDPMEKTQTTVGADLKRLTEPAKSPFIANHLSGYRVDEKGKLQTTSRWPNRTMFTRLHDMLESSPIYSRSVLDVEVDRLEILRRLRRLASEVRRGVDRSDLGGVWKAVVRVENQLIVTKDLILSGKSPISIRTHHINGERWIHGLRVYPRPNIPLAGSIIEAAAYVAAENIGEMIPISSARVEPLEFIDISQRSRVQISSEIWSEDLARLLPCTPDQPIYDFEDTRWDKDYGHMAFHLSAAPLMSAWRENIQKLIDPDANEVGNVDQLELSLDMGEGDGDR